ncbi:cobalt-precorrin-6A reductase, partial [filamentous cyanobacterium CCP5]
MVAGGDGGRLWLIGGTRDSANLAQGLGAAQVPCTVTVTTVAARQLYAASPWLRRRVGRLSPETIEDFLGQESITAILDASHPFAAAVSELAIATAQQYQLPYLRY